VALDGTAWQLVRIESMDGTVFTPDERGKYTLTFEPAGRLVVRVDCNRGRGSWSREGENGLTFGPLATTRAACPPGSLHDRLLSDLGYVRSFVEKEGHIFLATMADGAILEFEPLPGKNGDAAE
jgi:para-nitrobenzyl esterase